MTSDIYSNDEKRLLTSWFEAGHCRSRTSSCSRRGVRSRPVRGVHAARRVGGAFAVRDIQERLPNTGICRDDGVILTRPIVKSRRSKRGRERGAVPVPDQLGGFGARVQLAGGLSPDLVAGVRPLGAHLQRGQPGCDGLLRLRARCVRCGRRLARGCA